MLLSITGLLYLGVNQTPADEPVVTMEEIEWNTESALAEPFTKVSAELTDVSVESDPVEILHPIVKTLSLTTEIKDRDPLDELTFVDANLEKFFVHTSIETTTETTISHVYKFDGEEIARVPINVGVSPGWRCWSSKFLDPIWVGNWTVEIQSENGDVLAEKSFTVTNPMIEIQPQFEELEAPAEEITIIN